MISNYQKGIASEKKAFLYLRKKGFLLIRHRLKTPYGEIDLLMKKQDLFLVAEVKQRSSINQALYAIDIKQQKRIIDAFCWWQSIEAISLDCHVRFDVIVIDQHGGLNHLENAFQLC
jgi:putative endonuclease